MVKSDLPPLVRSLKYTWKSRCVRVMHLLILWCVLQSYDITLKTRPITVDTLSQISSSVSVCSVELCGTIPVGLVWPIWRNRAVWLPHWLPAPRLNQWGSHKLEHKGRMSNFLFSSQAYVDKVMKRLMKFHHASLPISQKISKFQQQKRFRDRVKRPRKDVVIKASSVSDNVLNAMHQQWARIPPNQPNILELYWLLSFVGLEALSKDAETAKACPSDKATVRPKFVVVSTLMKLCIMMHESLWYKPRLKILLPLIRNHPRIL